MHRGLGSWKSFCFAGVWCLEKLKKTVLLNSIPHMVVKNCDFPPFGVTSAEVAINCLADMITKQKAIHKTQFSVNILDRQIIWHFNYSESYAPDWANMKRHQKLGRVEIWFTASCFGSKTECGVKALRICFIEEPVGGVGGTYQMSICLNEIRNK